MYMQQMPEDERPIRGTKGVQKRRQRLQYQVTGIQVCFWGNLFKLPAHDCYPDKARSVQTEEVKEEMHRFVKRAKQNVAIGQVVHTDDALLRSHEFNGQESQIGQSKQGKLICRECKNIIMPDSVGILPSQSHANKKVIE